MGNEIPDPQYGVNYKWGGEIWSLEYKSPEGRFRFKSDKLSVTACDRETWQRWKKEIVTKW